MNYKNYFIFFNRYHWGYEGVAIPDEGETIRWKFIGYTKREMMDFMKDLITDRVEVCHE